MRRVFEGRGGLALMFVLGAVIASAATAGAATVITGKQIKDGSISSKDLSKAVRQQLAKAGANGKDGVGGRDGANGKDGVGGRDGANGKDGANGATKVVVRTGTSVLNAGFAGRATAMCVGNERAVGGSATSSNTALNDWIIDSEPINTNGVAASSGETPVGWSTQMHGDGGTGAKTIIAYVICASP